jgi:succinyl-diaminopimelate desuccinylase
MAAPVATVAINIDVHTTVAFDGADAEAHLAACRERLGFACEAADRDAWPAFRLAEGSPLQAAMMDAIAASSAKKAQPRISGPSNAGNVAAAYGIPTTAGFGVACKRAHGADESIDITTIPTAYAVHVKAMERLLRIS